MDFDLNDEQRQLKDSVERLLAASYGDLNKRMGYMKEPKGYSTALWKQYADLGLLAVPFSEEHGGLGSTWLANNRADLLHGYQAAIAFDRKGTSSIITHQGSRTCSDAFAMSLSTKLGGTYSCDDTGTFTDTASYEHLIGECTNVSVGYLNNHGPNETLDMLHVVELRDYLVKFDPAGLTYSRTPGDTEEDSWEEYNAKQYPRLWSNKYEAESFDEALIELCHDHPASAAKLIEMLGGNASDMLEQIQQDGSPVSYYSG